MIGGSEIRAHRVREEAHPSLHPPYPDTPMKKVLLLALAIAWCAPSAIAQDDVNADATVTANVITALSITKDADLDFGTIAQGVATTVAKADAGVGKFTIAGEAGSTVSITYTQITNLAKDADNLPYTQVVSRNTAVDATTGNLYVYLSGTVTPAADQAIGAYSATVNVQVAY